MALLDLFNDPVRMGLLSSGIATIDAAKQGNPNAALIGPQMMAQIAQQQRAQTEFGWQQQDRQAAQARLMKARQAFKGTPFESIAEADPETALKLYSTVIADQLKPRKPDVQNVNGHLVQIGPDGTPKEIYSAPEKDKPFVNAGEGRIYDPNTGRWLTAPGMGSGEKPPSGYRWNKDGALEYIPGGPADPAAAKKNVPSEDERKASGWYQQAMNSYNNMLAAIAEKPASATPGFWETVAPGETLANMARDPVRQKYAQASSSFAEAALRAATGAGVNKEEAQQKIRELTPQYGDAEPVKEQKQKSLVVYLNSLYDRAARAAPDGMAPPALDTSGWSIKPKGQ